MTIFYPDVSDYQAGISFSGCAIAVVKATEGTGYTNPDYAAAKTRAANAGAYFCAYHFLHAGNGAAQASYAFSRVGSGIPLMIDCEPTYNSNGSIASAPQVSDVVNFINEYRSLGGTVHLLYLPRWYWQGNLGQVSLAPVIDLGMLLVSSNYTSYSDTGPGWAAYGGMTPVIWQYTSTASLNGVKNVDMNAYQGSLEDFKAQVSTGAQTGANPVLSEGDTGQAVTTLQTRLNVWGATLTVDGDFGPATLAAVKAFQTAHNVTVDGVVGPQNVVRAQPESERPGAVPGPGRAGGRRGDPGPVLERGHRRRHRRGELYRPGGRPERRGLRHRDPDHQFRGPDRPGGRLDLQHPGLGQRQSRRAPARDDQGHRLIRWRPATAGRAPAWRDWATPRAGRAGTR